MEKLIQGLKNIVIAYLLSSKFRKNMLAIIREEQRDPEKYSQDNYSSCRERAADMVGNAIDPVISFFGLCVADHRSEAHGEDVTAEIASLEEETTKTEQTIATMAWWKR